MSAWVNPSSRPGETTGSGRGIDLLRYRPIRALIRWRAFPGVFQVLTLAVFVFLMVIGWGLFTPEGVDAKLHARTNLVNLVIWGIWWPSIVWVTFFLGRAWCVVCPLEWVSSRAESAARWWGKPRRPLDAWLARGGLVLVFFAGLQMLIPGIQIHRVPHYTACFLGVSLMLAFAVGLVFKDRAFCRGFCPVALLLSAYGRGGMLAVRPADSNCCRTGAQAPNARACPSLLNPSRLNTNKDCLVCGDCIKADSAG
jgi:polyferredoxin